MVKTNGRYFLPAIASISLVVASCGGGGGDGDGGADGSGDGGGATTGTPVILGVSGTLSQGQSITISGSSFGAKARAGPMLWDNFDDAGTSNIEGRTPQIHQGNLSSYNQWEVRAVGTNPLTIVGDNSGAKAGSTGHARAEFNSNNYWNLSLNVPYSQFTTGNELYISFYYRFTKTSANFGRQTKAWVAYNADSLQDKAYWTNSFGGPCQSGNFWRTHATESADEHGLDPDLSATGINGEWVRFESYLKQSGAGMANGAWHQAAHRPTLTTPSRHVVILNNYKMRQSSENWVEWTFGGAYYDKCGADTATIDIDDFYMDNTPAHVEVCNAATHSASARCELQLPTAWSDTSITATFKKGYLPSSVTAYVYVIDAAGRVNAAGFPILVAP